MSRMKKCPFQCKGLYLISMFLLCIFFLPRCHAFEPGHYDGTDNSDRMLGKTIESADREIDFVGLDKVNIGICKVDKTGGIYEQTYFARDQLQNFFSSEKHKNLLAVRFRAPDLNAVKAFALGLGYKRVIIYNYRLLGIELFYDSDNAIDKQKKTHLQGGSSETKLKQKRKD